MNVLLINKFLYPKGGDAIVTLGTGGYARYRAGHEDTHRPDVSPDGQDDT